MQLGVRNDDAAARAEAAGLRVVMNRCPKIEYGRLHAELGWGGFDSKVISSKKRKKKKKIRLRLGKAKFTVAQGKAQIVKITITKKNQRRLRKLRSVKVLLTGTFHVGSSKTLTTTNTVRYKVAKARNKKKHS